MGLTPAFRLIANGADVTEHIAKNLVSLSFKDEDGLKSDSIEVKVYGDFKRPAYKDELKLYLSYEEESEEFYCGLFVVQNTVLTLDGVLSISATATNFSNSLKELKNREFKEMGMCEIVSQIGGEQGLSVKCDFDDVFYKYKAQTHESDIAFLGRLAKELNAVYSVKNDTILFLRQDEKASLKSVVIDALECESLSIKNSNKTFYKSAVCNYHDTKKNSIEKVETGSEKPCYKMQKSFTNKNNLKTETKAKLATLNRGIKSGSFKTAGRGIYARSTLRFLNITSEDDVAYRINSISHTLDGTGWSISAEFTNS